MDLAELTSHIQLFSSFLVALTGAVALVIGIIKPIRNWMIDRLSNRKRSDELLSEVKEFRTELKDLSVRFDEERAEQTLL